MDEQRLADALRGAVTDPPPPSFDHADVVRASRRVTARRRSALAGSAMVVLVLAGVGVVTARSDTGDTLSAAAPAAPGAAREAAPHAQADAGPPADALAAPAPAPPTAPGATEDARSPGAASSPQPPLGPGDPGTCANRQDPALRALVEEVLPEVVGAPEAPTTQECRPGGERGVNVELAGGVLTVEYLPPGVAVDPVPGAVSASTASGGTVVVAFSGSGGPGERRLAEAAGFLAPQL